MYVDNIEMRYFENLERQMCKVNPAGVSRKRQVINGSDFPFTFWYPPSDNQLLSSCQPQG